MNTLFYVGYIYFDIFVWIYLYFSYVGNYIIPIVHYFYLEVYIQVTFNFSKAVVTVSHVWLHSRLFPRGLHFGFKFAENVCMIKEEPCLLTFKYSTSLNKVKSVYLRVNGIWCSTILSHKLTVYLIHYSAAGLTYGILNMAPNVFD